MSTTRTAWHVLFAEILKDRAPPGFEIQSEVQLSTEPQRADYVIIHRGPDRRDEEAKTLRQLWPHVRLEAIAEYKSLKRPIRAGDLSRLLGYAGQYQAEKVEQIPKDTDLVLFLVVVSITPTLDAELARYRWSREALGSGYYRVDAKPWELYVISIDDVSKAEQDAWLALVGRRAVQSTEADQWFDDHTVQLGRSAQMEKLEGYDEMVKERLSHFPANLRRDSLKPEERLTGLSADELVLALAPEVLAVLITPEALERLSPHVREIVEKRLADFRAQKAH